MFFVALLFCSLSLATETKFSWDKVQPQKLSWARCPSSLGDGVNRLDCASLQVPLDYDCALEGNITLGITRHLARKKNKRVGQLVFNPGGPGTIVSQNIGAGLALNLFHQEILDSFDIIGVDLRGTGLSTPINCSAELLAEVRLNQVSYLIDDQAFTKARSINERYRESCLKLSKNRVIDYMDTVSSAKDIEFTRRILGGEKITFFGQSYGTQLGSQYAELFPDSLRAVLLDGVDDVSQYPVALLAESAATQEAALRHFFDWCRKQNAMKCPLAHTNRTLEQTWQAVLHQAVARKGSLTADQARNAVRSSAYQCFYSEQTEYPILAKGIYQALYQDNVTLLDAACGSNQSRGPSLYNASQDYALLAVTCADRPGEPSATAMKLQAALISSQAPLMNGVSPTLAFLTGCIGWPKPVRNEPHRIDIPRTNKNLKFLLVTTLYDPATSSTWAQTLQHQIGEDRAPLLVRNSGGHTTYFKPEAIHGPTVSAMNEFLLTLRTPPSGTIYQN